MTARRILRLLLGGAIGAAGGAAVAAASMDAGGAIEAAPATSRSAKSDDERKQEAFDLVLATIEALAEDREEDDKIWGSMIKQALKRQKPGFSESYHGFRSFSQLLEEAQARRLIEIEKDEKSGGYIVRAVAS